MDTIEVKLVKLNDGRYALKYPKTPALWNMEGYYFSTPGDTNVKIKLTEEQVEAYGLEPVNAIVADTEWTWLVERINRPTNDYYCAGDYGFYWSTNAQLALRFSRKQDARDLIKANCFLSTITAVEHCVVN
jgi:hypothetical protein